MSRFSVVAVHFTRECNMKCPFCYRPKGKTGRERPFHFFIDCVRYIKDIAPQIALGGGEPFLFPGFIKDLGAECRKRGVMLNVTTNGTAVERMSDNELRDAVKDVAMVSVSFDSAKWSGAVEYATAVKRFARAGKMVGSNLLMEPGLFERKGRPLFDLVSRCLTAGVDRVFLLYPKNFALGADIRAFDGLLRAVSTVFPGRVFTDDLTRQILEHGYPPWGAPCHFGKDIASIDEEGGVRGCSFDTAPVLMLDNPGDMLQLKDMHFDERTTCPYLVR